MSYPTCAEESRLHGEFAASSSTASEHARVFQVYPKSCSNWFVLLTIGVTLWRLVWLPDLALPHTLYASIYCEGYFEIYRPWFPFKIIIQIHLHLSNSLQLELSFFTSAQYVAVKRQCACGISVFIQLNIFRQIAVQWLKFWCGMDALLVSIIECVELI